MVILRPLSLERTSGAQNTIVDSEYERHRLICPRNIVSKPLFTRCAVIA